MACTAGMPPDDSRIVSAIRCATARSSVREVDVERDERLAGTDRHRAAPGMGARRAEVRGARRVRRRSRRGCASYCPRRTSASRRALRPQRGRAVQVDRQLEARRDLLPEAAGEVDALLERRPAERHERDDVDRPDARVGARRAAPCRSARARARRRPSRPGRPARRCRRTSPRCGCGSRRGEWSRTVTPSIWPMARTISSTTSGAAALAEVRHALDQAGHATIVPPRPSPDERAVLGSRRAPCTRRPLVLVAVPIGNLDDLSAACPRDARARSSVVAAEDTRHFATLARHHGIARRALSYHDHNEEARTARAARPAAGRRGRRARLRCRARRSSRDPGYRLVRAAIDAGIAVTSLPGPSAVTTALAGVGPAAAPVPLRRLPAAHRGRPAVGARRASPATTATLVAFEAPTAPHRCAARRARRRSAIDRRAWRAA